MDLTTTTLGRRLAAARVLSGMTQADVIRAARSAGIRGLSQTSFSLIENGKESPRAELLEWLCEQYAVEPRLLVDPAYHPFVGDRLAAKVGELAEAVMQLSGDPRR